MTTSDLIALVIGSYAAIVATITLIWHIRRGSRKVRVEVKHGYGVGAFAGQEVLAINIINNGTRQVCIEEVGFLLSNKIKVINPYRQGEGSFLDDGERASYYVSRSELADVTGTAKMQNAKVVAAYARDSTGKMHKCSIRKDDKWFSE